MTGRQANNSDKTRVCPYCRMEISIFATKCFHCGERVDPPRTDQRHFSMEDLGGRKSTNYAPSESVMAALETFRAELTGEIQHSSGGAVTPTSGGGDVPSESGLPTLDERSRQLASLHEESRPTGAFAQVYVYPRESAGRRLATYLAFVIVLAVLGVGGFGLYSLIKGRHPEPPPVVQEAVVPPNKAPQLLQEGKLLDALNAARDAVVSHETQENQTILAETRAAVRQEVEKLIETNPWTPEDLQRAVELATQAAIIDPCDELAELERYARNEDYAYGMMLVRPEPRGVTGKAQFRLNTLSEAAAQLGGDKITVEVGDEFAGRFELLRVGRSEAEVRDTLRDRRLIYSLAGTFTLAE